MDIKNCTAYGLIKKENLTELGSTGYLLEHKKTKAKIVLVENDDNNKVFTIGFRTPPKDSTGVAHIVEHTVLCGSREFPVKDPFIELAKGSLNTFLNAMTYPDKTVYPVASCNEKDFQNLMHVYLDAVFFPNIYKEEKIFRQEGWHYEMESREDSLKYNGVVFNEMKGVFSSPKQLLARNIQQSLFPDTAYGVESGGDPLVIPELTYEDYLDFHRRYYHPSNSYLYLYGDMDMEEKLNWIDEHYLKEFDYLAVDSEIALQKPFTERADSYGFYSATEGEDTKGKAFFSYNAVCGTSLDTNLYLAMQILEHVLIQSVGAPLKQALLDAGIGSEISAMYEESIRQPFFSIIAKNVEMSQKQEFLDVIEKTLSKLVEEGLEEKAIRAAINALEFQYREADFGSYPKGLMYGLQMFDSWLYDDEKPFIHVQFNNTFEFLKKQIGTGYFEKLIQTYLLENTHTSFVSVEPKVGLTALMEKEEAGKLADYKASLSEKEQDELVKGTRELKAYQEEPTPSESLTCIPLLAREDIGKKAMAFSNEEKVMAGRPALHHDIFTNGIAYLRLSFDCRDLKDYTPYLELLTELIGFVDTDLHDKRELSNEILLHAGSYSLNLGVYRSRKEKNYAMCMEVNTKTLYPEIGYVLGLIQETLTKSHLQDEKRLKEVIGELRSSNQVSLQSAGHGTAVGRALAYMSEAGLVAEYAKGIAYYDFLCDLEEHFEERKENLIALLQALTRAVFTRERIRICLTADKEGYEAAEKDMGTFLNGLPQCVKDEIPEPYWRVEKLPKNEGFKTAGKVQYAARTGDYKEQGIAYSGAFKVVKTILSNDYLWNEVRVKGGAYGVMCAFANDGTGYFVSYRDPKLGETNQVYEGVPEYLRHFDADEREMMKYIIGTISDLDSPLTPRAKGTRSYVAYMTGITDEDVQKERDEVLGTTQEKIRATADMTAAVLSDDIICVLGSEEKVKQEETLFESTRILK
ncbi:MAG: insulinase family protein [Lachnospiraceae bacterium]|nr:insulinase family protein [Lachnospiraceae bacterium]